MTISIYSASHQDRSGKIRWLLEEMNVGYEDKWLDFKKGDLESESYLKVNPLGRIPAVTINDKPQFDSAAIVSYLADLHIDKKMAPPLTASERLEYQQWMYFVATTVDGFVSRIMIAEDIAPGELMDKKMGEILTELNDSLAVLDQTLSQKDFLIGQMSAADICLTFHLNICMMWPEMDEVIQKHAKVTAYVNRMKARPAAVKAKVFSEE